MLQGQYVTITNVISTFIFSRNKGLKVGKVRMEAQRVAAVEMIHHLVWSHWCKPAGFRTSQTGGVASHLWPELGLTCHLCLNNILFLHSIGPREGLVRSSRHSHGDQRSPLCSGLSVHLLSSLWGVYEPWRYSPTSAAAIIPSSQGSKDLDNVWKRSAKGTAVMWDSETECNIIFSRDGITSKLWRLGKMFYFLIFFQMHSSQEKSHRGGR